MKTNLKKIINETCFWCFEVLDNNIIVYVAQLTSDGVKYMEYARTTKPYLKRCIYSRYGADSVCRVYKAHTISGLKQIAICN